MLRGAWRATAVAGAVMLCPFTARAADPGSLLALDDGTVALDVGAGGADSTGVKGDAALTLKLPDLPLRAEASASAGASGTAALWQRRTAKIAADWTGLAPLSIKLEASDEAADNAVPKPAWVAPPISARTGTADPGTQMLLSNKHDATVTASLPLGNVTVSAAAGTTSSSIGDTAHRDGSQTRTLIETSASQLSTTAEWHIASDTDATFGLASKDVAIGWSGTGDGRRRYTYLLPSAEIGTKLWPGAELELGAEREVSDYGDDTYAALAATPRTEAPEALAPDHAVTTRAALTQKFGDLKVEAEISHAASGTVTESADGESGPVPLSTPLLARTETSLTAMLPLASLGLKRFSLSTDVHLTSSRVKDPVTGALRRASGEEPFSANVALSHDLNRTVSLGLKAGTKGRTTYYEPDSISSVSPGANLGAFVSYKPGSFELSLNADGLAGARTATDDFFASTRADSTVTRTGTHLVDGPSFTLTLKKKL
jgi:hypothetical protein